MTLIGGVPLNNVGRHYHKTLNYDTRNTLKSAIMNCNF